MVFSRLLSEHKASYPGVVLTVCGFILPFVTLKENRVVEGSGLRFWEGTPPVFTLLILALVLSAFVPAKKIKSEPRLWITGFLLYCALLAAVCASAAHLELERFPYGRISPSSGFWIMLCGSLLFMSYRKSWKDLLPILVPMVLLMTGRMEGLGFIREYRNEEARFGAELLNHLRLSLSAVTGAVIIGVPSGVLAWRKKTFGAPVFGFVNSMQTIPSLALFGLLIAPLAWLSNRFPELRELGFRGVGRTPALIALTLYALLPIVRNTYTGLAVIEESVLEAGRGMGMNRRQLLFKIELPLGIPVILSGIRVSLVQTTGNTTVAALIGAGGLGYFVFRGLEQAAPDLIIMGVIPIIVLVTLLDRLFGFLIRRVSMRKTEAPGDTA